MREVKIETPLRTIVLHYDDSKPETDYEKELLESYIEMHNTYFDLIKIIPQLKYEYQELKYQIEQATKDFKPLKKEIRDLYEKAEGYANNPAAGDNWDVEVMDELSHIHAMIDVYHKETLTPVFDEHNRLNAALSELDHADEEFTMTDWSEYRELANELYSNYDNYSLDLVSFDQDDDTMREKFSECRAFTTDGEGEDPLFDAYSAFVKTAYDEYNTIKEMVANKHHHTGFMDNDISDSCAKGELPEDKMPKYLIPAGDQRIEDFKISYSLLASDQNHTMILNIPEDLVEDKHIGTVSEVILCLQHFPKLIRKMIFAMDFTFENEYGNAIPAEEWKGVPKYMQYVSLLQSLPFSIFFFQDQDIRAYIFFGDMIVNNQVKPAPNGTVTFEGEDIAELSNRMFNMCWSFMLYCYNTGFDPEDYILALLADYDLPITFEMVKEKFQADIASGIQVKIGKQNSPLV